MSTIKSFDTYWLDEGQIMVKNTITNLNKTLSNYQKYLNTLNAFYVVGGFTAGTFLSSVNPLIYIAYILPIAIVQFIKYTISVGSELSLQSLDLRSPLSINNAHNEMIKELSQEVKHARKSIGFATLAVVIGASVAFYAVNNEGTKESVKKEQREAAIQAANNTAYTTEVKSQKLEVTIDKNKIDINAKSIEATLLKIKYVLQGKDSLPKTREIKIPALIEYTTEIDGVKKLISADLVIEKDN